MRVSCEESKNFEKSSKLFYRKEHFIKPILPSPVGGVYNMLTVSPAEGV